MIGERIARSGFSISSPDNSLKETLTYRALNSALEFYKTELGKVRTNFGVSHTTLQIYGVNK